MKPSFVTLLPPDVPKIHNEAGVVLPSHAGPYEEGGDLVLICVVTGGIPTPKITWSSNGKTLPSTMIDYAHESTLSSRLVVRNLSRAHQHSVYSCQASNFYRRNVTANVTIELRLRPLAVEIVNGSSPLSADRRYIVQCLSVGSRPPAKITWWMGGVQLTATNQTTSEDGNSTLASLSFTPTREDHGKTLICRATNELVKRGTKETSMKLNVFYLPTLKLELGINMNPEDIEEGDDVYFECKVNANPSAYKVVWKHNYAKQFPSSCLVSLTCRWRSRGSSLDYVHAGPAQLDLIDAPLHAPVNRCIWELEMHISP
uniref:Ig-like domain-containing protein n=1 Tax=Anopheles farauti TaxID=69004 RepID=A0A182Q5U4_9DIPT